MNVKGLSRFECTSVIKLLSLLSFNANVLVDRESGNTTSVVTVRTVGWLTFCACLVAQLNTEPVGSPCLSPYIWG